MSVMKHRVTGHQINVDEASGDFWRAAGYREDAPAKKVAAKATPAKKTAAVKRSK